MCEVSVDPEFQALCPPLSDEEETNLKESLKTEGCRNPVLFWDTDGHPIIDGHTRKALCEELGISFPKKSMKFPDRHSVKCWILKNQLGRRNLTDDQRKLIRGRLFNELKGENTQKPGKNPVGHFEPQGNVAETIAKQDGVSVNTVKRDGKLAEAVDKLTPAAATQLAGTKVLGRKAEVERILELPKKDQLKVATVIGQEKAKTVEEAIQIAKVEHPKAPRPEKPPTKLKDAKDRLVPESLIPHWNKAIEFDGVSRKLSALLREVEAIMEDSRAGAYMDLIAFKTDLKNLKHALKFAKPYVVCRLCGGSGCLPCRKTGWMPESTMTRNAKE